MKGAVLIACYNYKTFGNEPPEPPKALGDFESWHVNIAPKKGRAI